jgi:hypothetical protein
MMVEDFPGGVWTLDYVHGVESKLTYFPITSSARTVIVRHRSKCCVLVQFIVLYMKVLQIIWRSLSIKDREMFI